MYTKDSASNFDVLLTVGVLFLVSFGVIILYSIAPYLFPLYFFYIVVSIIAYIVFSYIDFDILLLFSKHFYIGSIIFLLIPLLVGQVSRGAVRWIPIGVLTIQPSEIIRPFLLIFFAGFMATKEITLKRFVIACFLFAIPALLMLVQPSLGMTILAGIGFLGVLLATRINKLYLFTALLVGALLVPVGVQFLAPYQRARVYSFVNPGNDPSGSGYNSIQSTIAVGSGLLLGRGLGKGVQTQLSFLPEKQTDFVFAATAEELGFVGASLLLVITFFVLWRIETALERSNSPQPRAFLSGVILSLLAQVVINVGMNLGMLPITGLPFPLVSAGGSSLLGTMITLGMVNSASRS